MWKVFHEMHSFSPCLSEWGLNVKQITSSRSCYLDWREGSKCLSYIKLSRHVSCSARLLLLQREVSPRQCSWVTDRCEESLIHSCMQLSAHVLAFAKFNWFCCCLPALLNTIYIISAAQLISSSTFVPDLSSSTGMWSGFCDGLSYYLFCICDLGAKCLVSSALSSNWLQFKQIIQYCPWKTGARLSQWNLRRVISHHFVCFHSQYYVLPDLTQEHA